MSNVFRFAYARVSAKVGRCARCMRWSLRGALLGWLAAIVAAVAVPRALPVVLVWPVVFTILWGGHIIVFAGRTVHASTREPRATGSARIMSRRTVLILIRASMFAVAASAMTKRAQAQSECPGNSHSCPNTEWCCRPGENYLCFYDRDTGKSNQCMRAVTDEQLKDLDRRCSSYIRC